MNPSYSIEEHQAYIQGLTDALGLTYEEIIRLRESMCSKQRTLSLYAYIIGRHIDMESYDRAKQLLDSLEKEHKGCPDLIRLRTLIKFSEENTDDIRN